MKYIKNFMAYKYLLKELVVKGIKLKYRKSYLGILWSLLEPILMTIVLTIIFGVLFNNSDPTYPLYIITGRLLFGYFSQSTSTALRSIRTNASMIKKVYVPKYLYVLATFIYNYIIFLISMIVVFGLALILGITPSWEWLWIVLPLLLLFMLCFGVGMLLATIGVFFKDMEYLWSIITTVIMYASAIFYYPERIINSNFGWVLQFNPLYQIIHMFRNCIYGEEIEVFGLCYAIGFTFIAVIVGCSVFVKKQDKFILHL